MCVMLRYGLRARNGLTFDLKWRVHADRVQVSDAGRLNAMVFVGASLAFIAIAVYDIATRSHSPVFNGQPATIAPAFFGMAAVWSLLGFIVWTARRVVTIVDDRIIVDDYLMFVPNRFVDAPIEEFYLVRQPVEFRGPFTYTAKRTGIALYHEGRLSGGGKRIMLLHASKSFEKRAAYWDAIPVPIKEKRLVTSLSVYLGPLSIL